jgi:hypothetical protein
MIYACIPSWLSASGSTLKLFLSDCQDPNPIGAALRCVQQVC